MVHIIIDGKEIDVPPGLTILQACELAGVEIPRFCYHKRLSIAGNCRMCLVEIEKAPKLVSSCSFPIADKMVIHTNSPKVATARKGVMEFLLINHPLDCPICDQGGECDLQDQALAYGVGDSRFGQSKRSVTDKDMGPLVRTQMTRCIQCTRCVRFMHDVAGVPELGAIGRGEDMEIATCLENGLSSELSANIVDLCPVGALTFKPIAFEARSWEYKSFQTIDVMDAMGAHITAQVRHDKLFRILPRTCESINEEWISDKTRFVCDGLQNQRLDRPYIRDNGALREASWEEALGCVIAQIKAAQPQKIGAIAGDLACMESMQALKSIMQHLGSPHYDCRQDGSPIGIQERPTYLFNSSFLGIEKADALLLVGCDPRKEASVLNARIYQKWLKSSLPIFSIGWQTNWLYPVQNLGNNPKILNQLNETTLAQAQHPMVIVGAPALARPDGEAILSACWTLWSKLNAIRDDWNGFNVLHSVASRVGGLDIGFLPPKGGLSAPQMLSANLDVLYLLGADEFDKQSLNSAFIIYQGTHGDLGAQVADVILPSATYMEKYGTWTNTEGKTQNNTRVLPPPGQARDDVDILTRIFNMLGGGQTIPPFEVRPQATSTWDGQTMQHIQSQPFQPLMHDFYLTNPITRASLVMAQCSQAALTRNRKGGRIA